MRAALLYIFLLAITCTGLQGQRKQTPLFTLLTEKQTGISFTNKIIESDSLNVLKYEYLYNGAGVGVGDFNRDGLIDIFFPSIIVKVYKKSRPAPIGI